MTWVCRGDACIARESRQFLEDRPREESPFVRFRSTGKRSVRAMHASPLQKQTIRNTMSAGSKELQKALLILAKNCFK
jgi:hypothetical protein